MRFSAGAATIYRNDFVAVNDGVGQTNERQLDGLVDLGRALGKALNLSVDSSGPMLNGYALCTHAGLDAISRSSVNCSKMAGKSGN
jgi:hypothetical protein